MAANAVTRFLTTIKRYAIAPEQFDGVLIAAINVGLCLESGGSDRVADGFNDDLTRNGRRFSCLPMRQTQ